MAAEAPRGQDVLILILMFAPDGVSTAQIFGDLAEDLQRRGHRVRVLTSTPHYSVDEEARRAQPLARRWGRFVFTSRFRGVEVTHVAMPQKSGIIARRVASWLWFHAMTFILGRFVLPRAATIIVPSPLLTLGVVAWAINVGRRARFVYNVQELYPDLAVNSGYLRNPWIIGALRRLERFVYRHAFAVTVVGATMARRVRERAGATPVELIPNPADVDAMVPLPRDNDFARDHGLTGKFVVGYAGNMGPFQGLDAVLEVAALLRDEPGIQFLMVGEGVQRSTLEAEARARGLANLTFLPQQPYTLVPQIYASCDLSLVPLIGAAAAEAIPSKVARIMACASPVLPLAPRESDLANLVEQAGCGVLVEPGDAHALAAAIRRVRSDESARRAMGARGRAYAQSRLSRTATADAYDQLLRRPA